MFFVYSSVTTGEGEHFSRRCLNALSFSLRWPFPLLQQKRTFLISFREFPVVSPRGRACHQPTVLCLMEVLLVVYQHLGLFTSMGHYLGSSGWFISIKNNELVSSPTHSLFLFPSHPQQRGNYPTSSSPSSAILSTRSPKKKKGFREQRAACSKCAIPIQHSKRQHEVTSSFIPHNTRGLRRNPVYDSFPKIERRRASLVIAGKV